MLVSGFVAALATAAPPLAAQTSPATAQVEEQLQQLEDSLNTLIRIRDSLGKSSHGRPRFDTLNLGSIPVLTETELSPFVRPVLDSLNMVIDSLMGGLPELAVRPRMVVVTSRFNSNVNSPETPTLMWTPEWETRGLIQGLVRVYTKTLLDNGVPPAVALWVGGTLPLGRPGAAPSTYAILATADVRAATLCLEGSIRACKLVLMLDRVPNPEEILTVDQMIRRLARLPWVFLGQDRGLCVDDRNRETCARLLDRVWSNSVPDIPAPVRQHLLHTALRMGGRGALSRFVNGESPTVTSRLEAAALASIDSVVGGFLDDVQTDRRANTAITPFLGVSSLLWSSFFLFLALRSKRWQ